MAFFRALVFLLLVAGLLCFAMFIGTGQPRWRTLGVRIVKWTLIAVLAFFAVLLLEQLAVSL